MRNNIVLLICLSAALLFSCSSDKIDTVVKEEQERQLEEVDMEEVVEEETGEVKEEATDPSTMIHGKWEATELIIDENTTIDEVKVAKQVLDHLTNKDCFIITFTFNSDLTVLAENAVDHLDINIGATGLDIPCPEDMDSESSTYTYDGETLIIVEADGNELEMAVFIEEDTLTVDAKDLNIPNFNDEGQLVFKKRE